MAYLSLPSRSNVHSRSSDQSQKCPSCPSETTPLDAWIADDFSFATIKPQLRVTNQGPKTAVSLEAMLATKLPIKIGGGYDSASANSSSSPTSTVTFETGGKFSFLIGDTSLADTRLVLRVRSQQPHLFGPGLPEEETHRENITPGGRSLDSPFLRHPFTVGVLGEASESDPAAIWLDLAESTVARSEELLLHSTVLCANSPYFRAKLMGVGSVRSPRFVPHVEGPDNDEDDDSNKKKAPLWELYENVDASDLQALRSVIRFMYSEVRYMK